MIICFHCNPETKAAMDGLLNNKRYKSYGEVISVAVSNLTLLEKAMKETGAVVIGETSDVNTQLKAVLTNNIRHDQNDTRKRRTVHKENALTQLAYAEFSQLTQREVPSLLLLDEHLKPLPKLAQVRQEEVSTVNGITLDRWFFGQYNKLLPVKVTCRALSRLLQDYPEGIEVNDAATLISNAATSFGDFLASLDHKHRLERNNALSIAFPKSGTESGKSRARFSSQFVGYVDSHGKLLGLPYDYKLLDLAPSEQNRLLLTKAGWEFAVLRNPLLDGVEKSSTKRFSEDEVLWMLQHIKKSIPIEDFTIKTVLSAIVDGADDPEKLDVALSSFAPKDFGRTFSSSYLSSQRSGAVSRMVDLGLVGRIKRGIRVSYVVTETGKKYMTDKG